MSASSNALEAPIPKFSVVKEGGIASSPFPLLKSKDRQTGICLPGLNHSRSHPHCIYFVATRASSNALETSIPEFSAVKGGDVASSHSPLVKSKRSANRYLFAIVKLLLFSSPPHFVELELHASSDELEESMDSFTVAQEGDVASSPSPLLKNKDLQTSICLPWVNRSRSHPHCIYFVAMSASSNALETSIPEFSVVKDGDVASSPSPLIRNKDRQTGSCLPLWNCSYSHPPAFVELEWTLLATS